MREIEIHGGSSSLQLSRQGEHGLLVKFHDFDSTLLRDLL